MKFKSQVNHRYHVECIRRLGFVRRTIWTAEIPHNLVTTVGHNKYLDATLKTGLASPAWYVGLKGNGSVVAGDTLDSHAGWAEDQNYSNATRVAFTPGTIAGGAVDNSASKAVFNINGTTTIYGAFLCDQSNKASNVGTLLGGGDFTEGSRAVVNGDTLNVTVECSLTNPA